MKLIEVYRTNVCSPIDAEIRDIIILPTFAIVLRADKGSKQLKFWHCRVEWLIWYVNIRNPFNKRWDV